MINLTRFLRVGMQDLEHTFAIIMVTPPCKVPLWAENIIFWLKIGSDGIWTGYVPSILLRHSYILYWFLCRFNLFWLTINFSLCSTFLWACFIRYFLLLSISSVVHRPDFLTFLLLLINRSKLKFSVLCNSCFDNR